MEQATELVCDWSFWARPEQLPPPGNWRVWLVLAGRGWGKTRTGAEYVRAQVEAGKWQHVALVGDTAADARDVMVEGESGLLQIAPPWFRPQYEPSKRKLTWPNGAVAHTYSGDDPEQLRGPQHDGAWADELAKWRYADEAWANLEMSVRAGVEPRIVATTTPRPTPLIFRLTKESEGVVVTSGTTWENVRNLSPSALAWFRSQYEGTRLARQEIYAELLEDVDGALWTRDLIDQHRVRSYPPMVRIVIGVDPALTSGEDADSTGIIVVGMGIDGEAYVLQDATVRDTPLRWAERVLEVYERWRADCVVAETNNGGELVETVLRVAGPAVRYKPVSASRGKRTRAEPVVALYEQGRVHHVGLLAALEDEMTSYVPGRTPKSPDRMDALVWALTELEPVVAAQTVILTGEKKRRLADGLV